MRNNSERNEKNVPVSSIVGLYCRLGNFREDMRSFAKIKHSRNGEITQSFTDKSTYKSCPSGEFLTSQIFLLTLIEKIKFSGKFMDLHYLICSKAI